MDNENLISDLLKKIQSKAGATLCAESMSVLTADEITLWGFSILHEEVMGGGFIQLIHNGYGPFFFNNPFAKAMRLYGLHDLSKLLYKVKALYDLDGDKIAKDCSDEEFMALYEQYPDFDDLDDEFIINEESYCESISDYIRKNPELFSLD